MNLREEKQNKKRKEGGERRDATRKYANSRPECTQHTQKKDEKMQRDEDRGIKIGGWVCRGRRRATLVSAAVG